MEPETPSKPKGLPGAQAVHADGMVTTALGSIVLRRPPGAATNQDPDPQPKDRPQPRNRLGANA